jgi:hypothetical protein
MNLSVVDINTDFLYIVKNKLGLNISVIVIFLKKYKKNIITIINSTKSNENLLDKIPVLKKMLKQKFRKFSVPDENIDFAIYVFVNYFLVYKNVPFMALGGPSDGLFSDLGVAFANVAQKAAWSLNPKLKEDADNLKKEADNLQTKLAAAKKAGNQADIDRIKAQIETSKAASKAASEAAESNEELKNRLIAQKSVMDELKQKIEASKSLLNQQQLDAEAASATIKQKELDAKKASATLSQLQLDADAASKKASATLSQLQLDADAASKKASATLSQLQLDAKKASVTIKQKELDAKKASVTIKQQQLDAKKASATIKQQQLDADALKQQQQLDAKKASETLNQLKLDAKAFKQQKELDAKKASATINQQTLAAKAFKQQIQELQEESAVSEVLLDANKMVPFVYEGFKFEPAPTGIAGPLGANDSLSVCGFLIGLFLMILMGFNLKRFKRFITGRKSVSTPRLRSASPAFDSPNWTEVSPSPVSSPPRASPASPSPASPSPTPSVSRARSEARDQNKDNAEIVLEVYHDIGNKYKDLSQKLCNDLITLDDAIDKFNECKKDSYELLEFISESFNDSLDLPKILMDQELDLINDFMKCVSKYDSKNKKDTDQLQINNKQLYEKYEETQKDSIKNLKKIEELESNLRLKTKSPKKGNKEQEKKLQKQIQKLKSEKEELKQYEGTLLEELFQKTENIRKNKKSYQNDINELKASKSPSPNNNTSSNNVALKDEFIKLCDKIDKELEVKIGSQPNIRELDLIIKKFVRISSNIEALFKNNDSKFKDWTVTVINVGNLLFDKNYQQFMNVSSEELSPADLILYKNTIKRIMSFNDKYRKVYEDAQTRKELMGTISKLALDKKRLMSKTRSKKNWGRISKLALDKKELTRQNLDRISKYVRSWGSHPEVRLAHIRRYKRRASPPPRLRRPNLSRVRSTNNLIPFKTTKKKNKSFIGSKLKQSVFRARTSLSPKN